MLIGIIYAYSEPCQTFEMERFATIITGFQSLTIFTKRSIFERLAGFRMHFWIKLNGYTVWIPFTEKLPSKQNNIPKQKIGFKERSTNLTIRQGTSRIHP